MLPSKKRYVFCIGIILQKSTIRQARRTASPNGRTVITVYEVVIKLNVSSYGGVNFAQATCSRVLNVGRKPLG